MSEATKTSGELSIWGIELIGDLVKSADKMKKGKIEYQIHHFFTGFPFLSLQLYRVL
nr:hypothetical protein [Pedobacter panaciterrae]